MSNYYEVTALKNSKVKLTNIFDGEVETVHFIQGQKFVGRLDNVYGKILLTLDCGLGGEVSPELFSK
jgi:hypothetical protein